METDGILASIQRIEEILQEIQRDISDGQIEDLRIQSEDIARYFHSRFESQINDLRRTSEYFHDRLINLSTKMVVTTTEILERRDAIKKININHLREMLATFNTILTNSNVRTKENFDDALAKLRENIAKIIKLIIEDRNNLDDFRLDNTIDSVNFIDRDNLKRVNDVKYINNPSTWKSYENSIKKDILEPLSNAISMQPSRKEIYQNQLEKNKKYFKDVSDNLLKITFDPNTPVTCEIINRIWRRNQPNEPGTTDSSDGNGPNSHQNHSTDDIFQTQPKTLFSDSTDGNVPNSHQNHRTNDADRQNGLISLFSNLILPILASILFFNALSWELKMMAVGFLLKKLLYLFPFIMLFLVIYQFFWCWNRRRNNSNEIRNESEDN